MLVVPSWDLGGIDVESYASVKRTGLEARAHTRQTGSNCNASGAKLGFGRGIDVESYALVKRTGLEARAHTRQTSGR